jgi:SPP1 family phage portal protein
MLQVEQQIATDGVVDKNLLKAVLTYHDAMKSNMNKLKRYYDGEHDILSRNLPAEKPNNRVVVNYCKYISDIMQGYFIGKPVSYKYEDDRMNETFQDIHKYNDEQDENSELANLLSIYGNGYEIIFADENGDIRYNEVSPLEAIIAYDTKITPEPMFAVRQYDVTDIVDNTTVTKIEVYDKDNIYYLEKSTAGIMQTDVQDHFFDDVPIVEFINNKDRKGDFESIITMNDAYNLAMSNTQNDAEYFSDSYLALVGMSGTQEDDIVEMKQNRVLLLDEAGQAYFLVKPSNDAESEHNKERINSDIHKMSFIPDISDESFASNASGVAMSYKLFALDQIIANKERKFKTGLLRRLELICNFLAKKNIVYDYKQVEVQFSRNKPVDEKTAVEIFAILKGLVSDQTAYTILPYIEDAQKELEQVEKERENDVAYMPIEVTADEEGI